MESQRFSRRLRGLVLEEKEFEVWCFFCLLILKINSLASSLTRYLACCRKYLHNCCQKQWEAISNTCAHCKQLQTVQELQEEPVVVFEDAVHEERQCLAAWEALRLYGANNDEIWSIMNVSTRFVNHAIMQQSHHLILLQFPYRFHINCWTGYWQALDCMISDYTVDHRCHVIRLTIISRNKLNLFERMAFLRLIHSCIPISVCMFFLTLWTSGSIISILISSQRML